MSYVTCPLSPTTTATATDPPPSNAPYMHSRLDGLESHLCLGEPINIRKNQKIKNPKNYPKLEENKFLSVAILALGSLTRSLWPMQ